MGVIPSHLDKPILPGNEQDKILSIVLKKIQYFILNDSPFSNNKKNMTKKML